MAFTEYYIQESEGTYLLHFPNFEGYTVEEVNEMFSEFGKVESVDNRGQVKGLCFVRYTDLESVIACINGFQSHKKVRILRHKQPSKNTTKSKSNANDEEKKMASASTKKSKNSGLLLEGTSHANSTPVIKTGSGNRSRSSSAASSFIGDSVSMVGQKTALKDEEPNLTRRKYQKLLELKSNASIKSNESICNLSETSNSGNVAQEVVVANIHPNYGIHCVLHLFERYGPIAVSLMKIVPKTKIRYCIVYFRSAQAAEAIEDAFDNFSLAGRSLIVLRPHILKREASCTQRTIFEDHKV